MADFPLMINENVMMTHLKCIKGGFWKRVGLSKHLMMPNK